MSTKLTVQQQNNDKIHLASVSVSLLGCVRFPWVVLGVVVLVVVERG